MTSRDEMKAAIEAILFVATEPVAADKLLAVFEEKEREQASEVLEEVLGAYSEGEGRGVMAEVVAGGVRLVTRPEFNGYLRRYFEITGRTKLSMAALETLAIVAYRQPVTGPEVQDLRGVNSSGVLKTLLERRLIRVAGRKPVVGKPFLYSTSREFLMHFGLQNLDDLPPLEEFEEVLGAAMEEAGAIEPDNSDDHQIDFELDAETEGEPTIDSAAPDTEISPEEVQ